MRISLEMLLSLHGVKLVQKSESRLMVFFGWLLQPVNKKFLSGFWTTVTLPGYRRIFFPTVLTRKQALTKYPTISHELKHIKQADRLLRTSKLKWVSNILFNIFYLCFPLPVLNWFRWRAEREAYVEGFRVREHVRGAEFSERSKRLWIRLTVNSLWNSYFYTWPRGAMRKWFERELGLK